MIGLFKAEDLQKSGLTAEALLIKFKEQLLRDFEMCNLDNYLSPFKDMAYESIHANLCEALKKIMVTGSGHFQQLLYRIDISEKQLASALNENKNSADNDVLADLIIKRILQKVILKVIYSK